MDGTFLLSKNAKKGYNTYMSSSFNTKIKSLEYLNVAAASAMTTDVLLAKMQTQVTGLSAISIKERLEQFGPNEIAAKKPQPWYWQLLGNFKDPLSILLLSLGILSGLTGDSKATIIICTMLTLSVLMRFVQEKRADKAANDLKAMVHTTTTVVRAAVQKDINLAEIVPGDIVHLSSGDMIPADLRILVSKDLFVNQSSLTGEALPVEKHAQPTHTAASDYDMENICYMGTNVVSGTAAAVVFATGDKTRFGSFASKMSATRQLTSFDQGINKFTYLMLRFIGVMVPLVFLINGFSKGNWLQAFLFAMAVAVGLTPEMLPMIVTVNLSKGALEMSRRKVIVKRLNAIQNFGAMDVLCTDKTGTLTLGRVVLIKHVDITGAENVNILDMAYLNSFYQTGLKNILDTAVLKHDSQLTRNLIRHFTKIDEIPFDFVRRRMSVVVENEHQEHFLVCKGASEEILAHCSKVQIGDKVTNLEQYHHQHKDDIMRDLSNQGFRLIAQAIKKMPAAKTVYKIPDESDMTLLGFLAFLDPPKSSSRKAIAELHNYGVNVKILTGDNELVAAKICEQVGISHQQILLGSQIAAMSEQEFSQAVEDTAIFAKLEPQHKERIIKALQARGHVVGFMGDGINDAPALKVADVGISVDSAVDIAKESSDIILLKQSLLVLKEGVREGRKIFANINKYIKMTASSNFGNMFSVLGSSIFLPFLPMQPIQVITNNLLYDISQIGIPSDHVDEEYLQKPRRWDIKHIRNFIIFLGPVSSVFDYLTYFAMLYIFHAWQNPALFQTGWFVESLFTQTLIIHVIRTQKLPFVQSKASRLLTITTTTIVILGALLPFSPLAAALGFTPLPLAYFGVLTIFLLLYFVLAELIKRLFIRRFGWE